MAGEFSPITLRLEPGQIPAVRAAIDESLAELRPHLVRLGQEGYIPEPWLGDKISAEIASYYNTRVMDSRDGPYAALVAYEAELTKVRENLVLLEHNYHRNEAATAASAARLERA
jgi:hypothetical protein